MWVYENKTGKVTEANEKNAREMVKKGGGFSALWPRGTDKEEEVEFERLVERERSIHGEPEPEKRSARAEPTKAAQKQAPPEKEEVHVLKSRKNR